MVRLTIDEKVAASLAVAREQVELQDESGQRVGYFLPPAVHERLLYDWAESRISEAEIKAARDETGGAALAELWARLDEQ